MNLTAKMFLSTAATGAFCNFSWVMPTTTMPNVYNSYMSTCNSTTSSTATQAQLNLFDTISIVNNGIPMLTLTAATATKYGFTTAQIT